MLDELVFRVKGSEIYWLAFFFSLVLLFPKFYSLFSAQDKISILPKRPVSLWLFFFR